MCRRICWNVDAPARFFLKIEPIRRIMKHVCATIGAITCDTINDRRSDSQRHEAGRVIVEFLCMFCKQETRLVVRSGVRDEPRVLYCMAPTKGAMPHELCVLQQAV